MIETKKIKVLSLDNFDKFITNLIKNDKYEVIGVKAKGKRFAFSLLENSEELRLDHDVTILPPKKYFLPQYETLMEYNLEKQFDVKAKEEIKPRIIIGIHPYDVIALEQMDKVYLDSQKDDFYKKRRDNAILIASDIQTVSDRSFASSMNTNVTDKGFDLLLTNIVNKYTVTIGTEKGKNLLEKFAKVEDAKESDIKKIDINRKKILNKYKKIVLLTKEDWPYIVV